MLGAGITAGVAPLLFVQLLHQQRFYTASLLLGPRWMAVVPALIVGFYALYLAKLSARWHRIALAVGLACFGFVAWSWSELHELMQADPAWHAFYAAGQRFFLAASIAPRFVILAGAMATTFAMVAAWSAPAPARLAPIAVCARIVSIGGAVWLWQSGFHVDGPARTWFVVLALAIGAAVLVREAPRVALIEPTHALAANAGGTLVFAVALAVGVAAIAYVIRLAR
jgi:hypothetical protein